MSDTVVCSTGTPQGTVLALFLFALYTADFSHQSPHSHLQKISYDSAIAGLTTDRDNRKRIKDFVDQQNHLQLNSGKTNELVVDFCRHKQPCTQVTILGMDIKMVTSYKFLGVHMNNKLDWTDHNAAKYKKCQSRLHLLKKLRSFGVQGALLTSFSDSVVASAIFYGVVCWSSSILVAGRRRIDKPIKKASSTLGCPLEPAQPVETAG